MHLEAYAPIQCIRSQAQTNVSQTLWNLLYCDTDMGTTGSDTIAHTFDMRQLHFEVTRLPPTTPQGHGPKLHQRDCRFGLQEGIQRQQLVHASDPQLGQLPLVLALLRTSGTCIEVVQTNLISIDCLHGTNH